jgi:hypothetical protein
MRSENLEIPGLTVNCVVRGTGTCTIRTRYSKR